MTDFSKREAQLSHASIARLDELGEQIAREQDAVLAKRNMQAEVRSRIAELDVNVLRRDARSAATRRAGLLWAGGGVALAAAALALISVRGLDVKVEPKALSVQLADQHRDLDIGQYVQAPQSQQVGLRFSDGSHIEVAERSRARLMGLRTNGADVSLESGLMHVQVQHRQDTSWHIGAGPFGVHVIGTRFDVQWKPEDDSFELTLHEGKVELSGCAFPAGYRILSGQTVHASCKSGGYDVTPTSDAAAGSGSASDAVEQAGQVDQADRAEMENVAHEQAQPEPQQEAADKPAVEPKAQRMPADLPEVRRPASPVRPAAPAPAMDKPARPTRLSSADRSDFRALARGGQYNQALRAAKAAGFEQECERANVRDLSLLAYAARYAQDAESETYAWRLLRERFRGTKDAAIAAFALGRIEFDNHGAYAKAAEWFRTYLREQPQGDLTREALGRLLEATQHLGDRAGARELAARYLREYPGGPYAGLAERLRDEADSR